MKCVTTGTNLPYNQNWFPFQQNKTSIRPYKKRGSSSFLSFFSQNPLKSSISATSNKEEGERREEFSALLFFLYGIWKNGGRGGEEGESENENLLGRKWILP